MDKLFKVMPLFYYDVAAVVVYLGLLFSLRKGSTELKKRVLFLMCSVNFIFYIINDYYFYKRGDNILTLMPLQLCNIAVFLVPAALLLRKQLVLDFVFYICVPGALAALLVPSSDYIGITYSLMTISFFVFHFFIAAIPFLLAGYGLYKPEPTIRKALKLSVFIFILAGIMHMLNLVLGKVFHVEANYFFTIIKYSAPRNPLFLLFSRLIPWDLLYLLPALIVLYFYMLIVFVLSGLKARWFKDRKQKTSNSNSI